MRSSRSPLGNTWRLGGLLLPLLVLLTGSPPASAQRPANPWAQVKVDAVSSVRTQSDRAVQARLQQWFMAKVRAYQHCLDDTALGTAVPRIIDLGDFTAQFQRWLAPPGGRGEYHIFFGEVGAPSTLDDITFPVASSNAYIDAHPDTCWHEFQHAIVMESEKAGTRVAAPLADWEVWRKPPTDEFAEHIYIESLAEFTVEWLDLLLHERSALTGGPGLGFEKHARDAWAEVRSLHARNENITFAVEYSAWAKAHDAWARAWEDRGRLIAPLPPRLRADYQAICGVHIGFVEEIIRHYMNGGLRAADGTAIRVPEWVMWPDPMRSGVIVGHLNEKQDIAADTLRYGFDVRAMETYRHAERSASLNHGKVTIALETPDAESTIAVSVDGKPTGTSPKAVTVDLAPFQRDSAFRITLKRGKLSSFAGVKRYRITVSYQDNPRIVNGVAQPSFYYPAKAIYYIDVRGRRPAASATAPAARAGRTAAASATAVAPKGRWVLSDVTTTKTVDPMYDNQPNFLFNVTVSESDARLESTYRNPDRRVPDRVIRTHHTWSHPGTTLTALATAPITITVADSGSANLGSLAGSAGADSSLLGWTRRPGATMGIGLFPDRTFGGLTESGGGASLVLGSSPSSRSYDAKIPVPDGVPGETLHIRITSRSSAMTTEATFNYNYAAGPAAPPAPAAAATLVAEEPAPQPDPPPLDNQPPQIGEVVKIVDKSKDVKVDGPPTPPRRPQPEARWYVHPSGDYRFRLAANWKVSTKHFFADADNGYDTLWPPDEGIALICARDFADQGQRSPQAVLQAFADKQLKGDPGAKSERLTLGGAAAVRITTYDQAQGVMTWHLAMFHKGRSYYLAISQPAKAPAPFPDAVTWMLNSVQLLR